MFKTKSTRPYTVIMTACFRPDAQFASAIVRTNVDERRADYATGLRFWLALPDPRITRIIFIENTSGDLAFLEEIARRENPHQRACEFISIDCNRTPAGLHYGYAEFDLIDEGLKLSRLYPESAGIIKATGRYAFPQITRLLNKLPADFELAVDTRNNRLFSPKPYHFVPSPLLVCSRSGFEAHVRTAYRDMHLPPPWHGQFIEDVLYDRVMKLKGRKGYILRWPVNCDPMGLGANGDRYRTPKKRLFALARGLGRIIIPGWWF